MKKISILVVTYGTDLHESLSLKSILNLDLSVIDYKPELKIWMNKYSGEKTILNKGIYEKFEVEIIKSKENKSLPIVYNQFLLGQKSDYAILLDQDSIIESDYISEVYKAINETSAQLLLPKVVHGNTLVSPGRFWFVFGSLDPSLRKVDGIVNDKNIVAINSGLVVKVQLIKDGIIRYDERLRFYFTDTKFLLDYNKLGLEIYLLESVIKHDLSELSDSSNTHRACIRFNDMVLGFRTTYPNGLRKVLLEIYLTYVATRYSIRFKSVTFFKLLVG
jgi:GT2 family glycosyltransferase